MSMNKRYDIQINFANELRENYFNFKQNQPSIIEPINYPISLSDVRTQLINWLIFLCDNLNFSIQTLNRSVIIFDQFISKNQKIVLTQENLKLIAISSLSLGTKLEEINCNYTSFFTEKVLNSPQCEIYKKSDLTKMEFEILKKLNFKTLYSTAFDFASIYLQLFKMYCNSNEFLYQNFTQVYESQLKSYLLNDMFITMSQSDVAYIAFSNSFNYMGLNNIIFKNIEYLLLGSFIINSKNDENIKYHNNMNKGNKCNYLALRSL
jgi:hypothetical protein